MMTSLLHSISNWLWGTPPTSCRDRHTRRNGKIPHAKQRVPKINFEYSDHDSGSDSDSEEEKLSVSYREQTPARLTHARFDRTSKILPGPGTRNLDPSYKTSSMIPHSSTPTQGAPQMTVDTSRILPQRGDGDHAVRRKEKDPIRFGGKSDWLDYLRHFEAVSEWNQWGYNECGLQLAICLVDEAREVLSSLPRHIQNDYNSLVEALTSRYSPAGKESQFAFELMNRTCGLDENVTAFGQALRRLASKAYGEKVDDRILLSLFVKGLPDKNMQRHVHFAKPDTLAEAICLASEYESFEKPRDIKSNKLYKPREQGMAPIEQDGAKMTSKVEEALVTTLNSVMGTLKQLDSRMDKLESNKTSIGNRQSPRPKSKVECYACHEMGHFARNCPSKESQGQSNKTPSPASETESN